MAPGLTLRRPLKVLKAGICPSRFSSSASVGRKRIQGCSQPSRRQLQAVSLGDRRLVGPVQVDRQQLTDGCVLVGSALEGFLAAQHQQAAAPVADKLLQQGHLLVGEELRLQIVQDDGMIAKQLLGRLGKTVPQFGLILGGQAQQHGLVILFDLFLVVLAESPIERIGRLALASAKGELRFSLGHANQAHQVHLVILLEGAAEELVLPIGTACHVQHAVGAAAPVHHDPAGVVHGGCLRAVLGARLPLPHGLFGFGKRADLIEMDALLAGRS